jgi:SAM-dependent methyltransferase
MTSLPSDADSALDEATEIDRIRAVYAERDARPARHSAIAEAYRLINVDRRAKMRSMIERVTDGDRRVLDVGCGSGLDLGHWLALGWPADRLAGVDVVAQRLSLAREACPGVDLQETNGTDLPYAADTFDVATAVTVFSSILDPLIRGRLFDEMRRVVRPGGSIVVYDFVIRNPRNPDVVAMTARRLRALGGRPIESVRITPLLPLVAAASRLGGRASRVAMATAPRTHRLSRWVVER